LFYTVFYYIAECDDVVQVCRGVLFYFILLQGSVHGALKQAAVLHNVLRLLQAVFMLFYLIFAACADVCDKTKQDCCDTTN